MKAYCVTSDGRVNVVIQTATARGDAELMADDPDVPEWLRDKPPGLYGDDGEPLEMGAWSETDEP